MKLHTKKDRGEKNVRLKVSGDEKKEVTGKDKMSGVAYCSFLYWGIALIVICITCVVIFALNIVLYDEEEARLKEKPIHEMKYPALGRRLQQIRR